MKTKYNSTLSATDANGGDRTQKGPIRRKWSAPVLGGFLFTSIFALSAPSVEAQCEQWDVSGKWKIRQGSFTLPVVLTQKGKTVSGSAAHRDAIITKSDGTTGRFGELGDLAGSVNGTIEGDRFDVQINWARGGVGIYRGTIGKNGVINGMTYDKNKPSSTATWRSSKVMKCADEDSGNSTESAPEEPAAPTPKPIKNSGNKPTAPTPKPIKNSGSKPQTQSSVVAPTISAHPKILTIPEGESEGTVTVTWDGGPDHPDARPWLKEGTQGEEVMVADQGKGKRPITLERGKNYQFLLIDAGRQLAKAVVISTR